MEYLAGQVVSYFRKLDSSLEQLSEHQEGKLHNLPKWALNPRRIFIGFNKNKNFAIVKIVPDDSLEDDSITEVLLLTQEDINKLVEPAKVNFTPSNLPLIEFKPISDITIQYESESYPGFIFKEDVFQGILGYGKIDTIFKYFREEKAQLEAINIWNKIQLNIKEASFIYAVSNIFSTLAKIIKRKSFLERRIHRFLNEHRRILLPSFKNCFFELKFKLNGEIRKADFVLEREFGMPALLIELENPVHNIFTKQGEYTSQANHARAQIAEWVKFIDENPQENASGDLSFLRGKKERLVIMGRGLDYKEKMLDSRYSDTKMWTYELLIAEAKNRWNQIIDSQCDILRLKRLTPFK